MIKDILVHLNGSEGDEGRLAVAASICQLHEAFMTGIYVNIAHAPLAAGYAGFGAVPVMPDDYQNMLATGEKHAAELKTRMEQYSGISHEFRRYDVFMGEATQALCSEARTGDLIVCAQPYGKNIELSELTEALIFGSGRGVLIVPPEYAHSGKGFETIVLAWRNTKETARAVSEAMPFLSRAKKVIVVMVDEDGSPEQFGDEPGADIARHLSRHGCKVDLKHLSGWNSPAEAILNEAQKSGADLIVLGSYGHSRIRQWILGGVTRGVLGNAPIPVLTAH